MTGIPAGAPWAPQNGSSATAPGQWRPESGSPSGPPGSRQTEDERRFGVRCTRCARTQPPLPRGVYTCVYCGAPLALRRWVAHPPPGVGPRRRIRLLRRPYAGPPSYGGAHPAWGFPPVIWRSATVTGEESDARSAPRVRGLRTVAALALLTGVACVAAAAAEGWRFALLLQGRTLVLDGHQVRASDVLVVAAGIAALVLGALTALLALRPLIALHRAAAQRAGLEPSRTPAGLLARLVVPGWNLYGAGQVLAEIASLLRRTGGGRRRSTRVTVPLWWLAWVANGLLVLATLILAFGRSEQLMADTVELHIAVDLAGSVVAGLFAAVLLSFERAWSGRGSHRYAGWAVRPPESSARNSRAPAGGDGSSGAESSVGEPAAGDSLGSGYSGAESSVSDGPAAEDSVGDGMPVTDSDLDPGPESEESAAEPDGHPR
jgi:hypothetical protein